MKMIKILIVILVIAISFSACNVLPSIGETGDENTQINPLPEAANTIDKQVTLYFKYADENMLAGETRSIQVPVNEQIELTVLKEIFKGPSQDSPELKSLIPAETKIISVMSSGEYLFVTLSQEFITGAKLATVDHADEAAYELAIQEINLSINAIVNTLIELGGFSRIQILVDKNNSGRGERISLADIGDISLEGATLEPLGWKGAVILTPENTVNLVLTVLGKRDYEKLYALIAYNDSKNTERPTKEEFINRLSTLESTMEDYTVLDSKVSRDASSVIVSINFSKKNKDGDTTVKDNIILRLRRERDLWKVEYSSFNEVFLR